MRFFISIILFIGLFGVLYIINMPLDKKLVILAGAFYIVGYSLSPDWVFRGLEKMQFIFVGRIVTSSFFIGCVYLFVKTSSDVTLASIIYSFSFLIGSLIYMIYLHRRFKMPFSLRISIADWWVHIKKSSFFALNGAFNTVALFIPILFMGVWSTNDRIGIFSAAQRLVMLSIYAGILIVAANYSTLSNLYVSDRGKYKTFITKLHQLIVGISMPICIIASIFSNDLIVFIYGSSYVESVSIFNILVWYLFLRLIRGNFGIGLFSAGFYRVNMFITGAGAVVVTLVSIVLIPKYSDFGAIWAIISGEIFILALMSEVFRMKVCHLNFFNIYLLKVLIAGLVMGFLSMKLPFSSIYNTVIGILAYGLLSFSIGIVSMKTIQQVFKEIMIH